MTDLDDFWPPPEAPDPVPTPRKCKRHRWAPCIRIQHEGTEVHECCWSCGQRRDPVRSRRGRTARQRGNAYERTVAKRLGVSRVGQFGSPEDVAGDWIAVQVKNGSYYPERIDAWLNAIPSRSDRLRAVVIGDAPGAGTRRRELIVLDFGDFCNWFGGKR